MTHYVYELIDPINNKVFYVGKGSGRRMYVHEHRAKRPHSEINENKKLRNKIKSILNNDKSVVYNQIFFTENSVEAYECESKRIIELGLDNLCNRFIFPPVMEDVYKIISMRNMGHIISAETKLKIKKSLMGHTVSENTRRKMSECKKGKKNPCSEFRRQMIAKSKMPIGGFPDVISPDGKKYSINILSDFCREHNLRTSTMSELFSKKHKHHKGWILALG